MAKALLFAGQAAQYVGMGRIFKLKDERYANIIDLANEVMGFNLLDIMIEGPEESLKQTINTQPAVFLHSYLSYIDNKTSADTPVALAGHSLGEITALVAGEVLSFEDGLQLVKARAEAMQMACEKNPSTMAAILGMEDNMVENICAQIEGIVVPANYNCPGQLVISGSHDSIKKAIEQCKEAGARRALEISVGGAFHSPLMEPAMAEFKNAVNNVDFNDAQIPIYQNVDAKPHTNAEEIKSNIINQVVSPVKWSQTIQNMISSGINEFCEVGGKGKILMGMVRKVSREVSMNVWGENE